MADRTTPALRLYGAALRTLLALTVILGLAYPLAMTGLAQVAFGNNANGSLVVRAGKTVGSDLIGQGFTRPVLKNGQPVKDANGNPVIEADPKYFQSRPSAAGQGYDPLSSGASNLGPENKELIALINQRRATAAALDGVNPAQVAPDALLASGSGLDPQISPAYAAEQAARVARERGLSEAQVRALVADARRWSSVAASRAVGSRYGSWTAARASQTTSRTGSSPHSSVSVMLPAVRASGSDLLLPAVSRRRSTAR
jgi:potassium-transporting ATPase KdpC subunit